MVCQTVSEYVPPNNTTCNKFALAYAILTSSFLFILGYNYGSRAQGATVLIQNDLKLNDEEIASIQLITSLSIIVGKVTAGISCDFGGRRHTIVMANGFFLLGTLFSSFSKGYLFLVIGTIVANIGVGLGDVACPIFIAELSPPSSRGCLTSLCELFLNIGYLLGSISINFISKLPIDLGWRFEFGLAAIASSCLTIMIIVMPESPRWLVMQGQIDLAKQALHKVSNSNDEASKTLEAIKAEVDTSSTSSLFGETLLNPSRPIIHITITSLILPLVQQMGGLNIIWLCTAIVMDRIGINSSDNIFNMAHAMIFVVKIVIVFIAIFSIDKTGRRPLLLASCGGIIISLLGLSTCFMFMSELPFEETPTWDVILSLLFIILYFVFFSIGIGPMVWVYAVEMFPLRLRAQGVSLGMTSYTIISVVMGMTYTHVYQKIKLCWNLLIFAGVSLVAWLFFCTLPETKGRALEEIESLFGDFKCKFFATYNR